LGIEPSVWEVKMELSRIANQKGNSMARQLKRWESPRKEGRNNKGRGGSARQRQRRKQFQVLRQKLKDESNGSSRADGNQTNSQKQKREAEMLLFLCFPRLVARIPAIADWGR
jgi:hypothetical protein